MLCFGFQSFAQQKAGDIDIDVEEASVKEVLEVNKAQRHIRGGIATRKKYRGA